VAVSRRVHGHRTLKARSWPGLVDHHGSRPVDCQRQTGSAFSIFVVVPRATLHVGGDTLATYVTVGADSGEERQRQFCSKCGSPVVTLLTEQPELAVIKAGTLNDPSWLSPTLEVWCGSAQPWLAPIENSRRLARGLPA
jgi:hypothetical protein